MNIRVIDKRNKEKFFLDDAYLNGYAKLCGVYATGVYVSLCRHANTEQKCWPSLAKIAEELAISQTQTRRAIKILVNHNIISTERIGKKANNRYYLLDKSSWSDVPDRTLTVSPQDTHPLPDRTLHSKEPQCKEPKVRSSEDKPRDIELFDPLIELNKLLSDKQRHIQIIGKYAQMIKIAKEWENKLQLQLFIRRNVKEANDLTIYSDEKLKRGFEEANLLKDNTGKYIRWTLETVLKMLNK